MKLHQLKRSSGLRDKAKQRGRGNGTGTGNYSGKGLKGQKARSGHSMKAFFEGGQTSIIQRLPKAKGFKRPFKLVKQVVVINLGTFDQDKRIADAMEITKVVLKNFGYIKHETDIVKVLGDGDYAKHLSFPGVELFSKSAQEKIAAPGKGTSGKIKVKSIKDQTIAKAARAPKAKVVKAPKAVSKPVAKPLLDAPEAKKPVAKKAATAKPAAKKIVKKAE